MVSAESQQAMDSAKLAVKEFMSKHGHNDTSVHETVARAVYHETVSRVEHEQVTPVVDREVHQDHFHTSIQPITDAEILEEQHHSHVLPVEKRHFEHNDEEDTKRRIDEEKAKFRDHVEHVEGERTHDIVPVATSEHIHHHVHEIIQPIVNKHTVEPHIVHTLSFVQETHHQAAQHHATSALPAVSMAEFLRQGGILVGREERYDWFEGEPRSVGGWVGNSKNPTGSPVEASALPAAGQMSQASNPAPVETKERAASPPPTINVAPAPPMPIPERRTSMPPAPPAERPSSQSSAQPTAQPSAPEPARPTAIPAANPAAAPSAVPPPPPPTQPIPGRWNLLPLHFARSDDAARASQASHLPRVGAHPSVIQSVQAKADQQQQQRQSSVGQPAGAKPAAEPKR